MTTPGLYDYIEKIPVGQKHDAGKPDFSLIPAKAELEFAKVLTFGAAKYGRDNWRSVDRHKERYIAALLRHVNAYRSGEILDPESGCNHLAHAICCAAFLIEREGL